MLESKWRASCLALVLCAWPVLAAAEYEGYDVRDGGAIRGRVRVSGTVAAPTAHAVQKDVTVCGHAVEDRSLLVGQKGALANAVVFLSGIEAGKAIDVEAPATLDNRACRFEPHVQSLSVGQSLVISNSDPVLHNTHSYVLDGGRGNRFNLALARQGTQIRKRVALPGLHQVKCDAGHTWMNAYFYAFEHPYHTVVGPEGTFELEAVPPGTYTLHVWHETLGRLEATVRVRSGEDVTVSDFVYQAAAPKG